MLAAVSGKSGSEIQPKPSEDSKMPSHSKTVQKVKDFIELGPHKIRFSENKVIGPHRVLFNNLTTISPKYDRREHFGGGYEYVESCWIELHYSPGGVIKLSYENQEETMKKDYAKLWESHKLYLQNRV